jgi:hypothetical protein
VELIGRVGLEDGDGLGDGGAGADPLRGRLHVRRDPRELLLTPFVGLGQVDGGAEEAAAGQRVALDTDRVGFRGERQQPLAQALTHRPVCRGRTFHSGLQCRSGRLGQVAVRGLGAREIGREVAVRRGELGALVDARLHGATRRDVTLVGGAHQGFEILLEGARHVRHAGGDRLPLRGGVGGHEVEDVAAALHGRGEVVQGRPIPAGRGDLELQAESLTHGGDGDLVDGVDRLDRVERREGCARQCVVGGEAGGGEVVEFGVVTGDAEIGRLDRGQRHGGIEVGVGDGVDGGGDSLLGLRVHDGDATCAR